MYLTPTKTTPPIFSKKRLLALLESKCFYAFLCFLWLGSAYTSIQARNLKVKNFNLNSSLFRTDGSNYTPVDVAAIEQLIGKKVISIAKGKGI